jgi:hypothetical protein
MEINILAKKKVTWSMVKEDMILLMEVIMKENGAKIR